MACTITVGGFGASKFGRNKFGQLPAPASLSIPLACTINKSVSTTNSISKSICLECKLRLT